MYNIYIFGTHCCFSWLRGATRGAGWSAYDSGWRTGWWRTGWRRTGWRTGWRRTGWWRAAWGTARAITRHISGVFFLRQTRNWVKSILQSIIEYRISSCWKSKKKKKRKKRDGLILSRYYSIGVFRKKIDIIFLFSIKLSRARARMNLLKWEKKLFTFFYCGV